MILNIVDLLFYVYMIILFLRILGSWLPELQGTVFMQFVAHYADPYLNFFRGFVPPLGMIDLSPLVAFLFLGWVIEPAVKILVVLLFS